MGFLVNTFFTGLLRLYLNITAKIILCVTELEIMSAERLDYLLIMPTILFGNKFKIAGYVKTFFVKTKHLRY